MKSILFSLMIVLSTTLSLSANAQDSKISHGPKNFECDIFRTIDGSAARGKFELFGEDFSKPTFKLSVSEGSEEPRALEGTLHLAGKASFTSLEMDTQKAIISAMGSSRRGGLVTGDLVVLTNTKDPLKSTFTASLMPSGEIAYLAIGALPVLCM
jgi:hypothetical protein